MKNTYDEHFKKIKNKNSDLGGRLKDKKTFSKKRSSSQKSDIEKVREALERAKKKKKQNQVRKTQIPIKTISFLIIGLMIALAGLYKPQIFDEIIQSVDVQIFSQSYAQGDKKGKASNPSKEVSELSKKNKKENSSEKKSEKTKKAQWSEEEVNYFTHLNERKIELDQRELELEKLEEELQKQKVEIDSRIKKLKVLRKEISKILKERVTVDQQKVKKLVAFYSNMKPQQASVLLSRLDEDLAVEILGQMKKKNAADVLNLLSPEKAQNLSEKFAGYKFK